MLLEAATQKAIDSEPVRSLPWLTLGILTRTWAQEEVAEAAANGQQAVVAMVKAAREQLAPTPMGPAGVLAAVAQVAVPPKPSALEPPAPGWHDPQQFPELEAQRVPGNMKLPEKFSVSAGPGEPANEQPGSVAGIEQPGGVAGSLPGTPPEGGGSSSSAPQPPEEGPEVTGADEAAADDEESGPDWGQEADAAQPQPEDHPPFRCEVMLQFKTPQQCAGCA